MKGYKVKMYAQAEVSFPFYVNVIADSEEDAVDKAKELASDNISEYTFSIYKDSVGLDELPDDELTNEDGDSVVDDVVYTFEEDNDYGICVDNITDFYCLENEGDVEECEFNFDEIDDEDEEDEE